MVALHVIRSTVVSQAENSGILVPNPFQILSPELKNSNVFSIFQTDSLALKLSYVLFFLYIQIYMYSLHFSDFVKYHSQKLYVEGAMAYQLGNISSRTITEVKQR